MRTPGGRGNSPKERILQAAKREFAERGLSGSRVDSIARRARVNPALVHYYFENKEHLYAVVLGEILGEFDKEDMLTSLKEFNLQPPQKLYIALYLIVKLFLKPRESIFYNIIFRELADGGVRLKKITREFIVPGRRQRVLDIIMEGMQTGHFQTGNPVLLVHGVFSFMTDLVLFRDIHQDTPLHEFLSAEGGVEKILNYLLHQVFREVMPPESYPPLPHLPGEVFHLLDEIIRRF
jgi:AcrR family transcriptional regulator